jgi:hypothetical protein
MELHDLETLLQPVKDGFGKEKAALVEQFLAKQAQLGIKQKSSEMTTDSRLKKQVQEQIDVLQVEIDELRRQVGVYCMTYVRSIIPLDLVVEWMSDLEQRVEEAKQRPSKFDLWSDLGSKTAARTETDLDGEI